MHVSYKDYNSKGSPVRVEKQEVSLNKRPSVSQSAEKLASAATDDDVVGLA